MHLGAKSLSIQTPINAMLHSTDDDKRNKLEVQCNALKNQTTSTN